MSLIELEYYAGRVSTAFGMAAVAAGAAWIIWDSTASIIVFGALAAAHLIAGVVMLVAPIAAATRRT